MSGYHKPLPMTRSAAHRALLLAALAAISSAADQHTRAAKGRQREEAEPPPATEPPPPPRRPLRDDDAVGDRPPALRHASPPRATAALPPLAKGDDVVVVAGAFRGARARVLGLDADADVFVSLADGSHKVLGRAQLERAGAAAPAADDADDGWVAGARALACALSAGAPAADAVARAALELEWTE